VDGSLYKAICPALSNRNDLEVIRPNSPDFGRHEPSVNTLLQILESKSPNPPAHPHLEHQIPNHQERAKPHRPPKHRLSRTLPLARPLQLLITLAQIVRRIVRLLHQLLDVLALLRQIRVKRAVQFTDFQDTALGLRDLLHLAFVVLQQIGVFGLEHLELVAGEFCCVGVGVWSFSLLRQGRGI
jgi:hypothetical protein